MDVDYTILDFVSAGGLFVGMLILLEIGRRLGQRRLAVDPDGAKAGSTAVDGAVFGLLGLLIAFTFSGAASRFDQRRTQIVDETNAIGTAYLRLDLLSNDSQTPLREAFKRYLDTRLAAYAKLPDLKAANVELKKANDIQGEIWTQAVAACKAQQDREAMLLLLPALNQMFDITTTRTMASKMHPPLIVFVMLGVLALAGSLLAGYGMSGGKSRGWVHMLCFAAMMGVTVYVIFDIEYPRMGLIKLDTFDQALVNLRASMQ